MISFVLLLLILHQLEGRLPLFSQTNTSITTAANDLPPLLLILLLRDPHLLEGAQRALRLTLLHKPHNNRTARPGIERTVYRLGTEQLWLERLPSTHPTTPTAFRREESSLSSREDRPFKQQPPPAKTMLEVSSLRICGEHKNPNLPPHRSFGYNYRSCLGVGGPHPRIHAKAREEQFHCRS